MRDVVVIVGAPGDHFAGRVERAEARLRGLASRGSEVQVRTWVASQVGLAVLVGVPARDLFAEQHVSEDPHQILAVTGYLGEGAPTAGEVRRRIEIGAAGTLRLQSSPGGVAAYFLADAHRGRVYAWSSHAGLEQIYVTEGERDLVVSNRPLVSHLIGKDQDVPDPDLTFLRRAVASAQSVHDDTPYAGTRRLPPRTMLVASAERRDQRPHPVPFAGARFPDRSSIASDTFREALLRAVSVARRFPDAELYLSGGKDSRLLGAAVAHLGIPVQGVTFGSLGVGEGEAAARVAATLGVAHEVRAKGVAGSDALRARVAWNLRRADGLIAESFQLSHVYPALAPATIEGHAHHARNGFLTGWSRHVEPVREQLLDRTIGETALVVPDLVQERVGRIREILDGYEYGHPNDLAYWYYGDWRMTRWLSHAYLPGAREGTLIWPLMDEEVLVTSARVSAFDRAFEVTFFDVMRTLHPEVSKLPLYQSAWRFDRGGREGTEFREGYPQRTAVWDVPPGGPSPDRSLHLVRPLFREALESRAAGDVFREVIRPGVIEALLGSEEPWEALEVSRLNTIRFMWRVAALAMVAEGEWLGAEEPPPQSP